MSSKEDTMPNSKKSPSAANSVNDYVSTVVEQQQDWQHQMLKRLIESAAPQPIKVACTTPPPGMPGYLGEEYHGRISKEEEKRLLEGKTGRYLVRESFSVSRLNEYTLAFNHDGEIQHVKLIYNAINNKFKTDSTINEYKTILELITDVLQLFCDIKRRQSVATAAPSKKEKYSKPHAFKSHTYKHPKWCDECGQFLWGLFNQGYKCEDCGVNVHKSCKELAPVPCSKVTVGRKISNSRENGSTKKRGSRPDIESGSSSPPTYVVIHRKMSDQCQYFRKCSRFLSAFNIRDTYVDLNHTLTRCFCDKCIDKRDRPENTSTVKCNSLKQWTRFQFEQQDDILKRNFNNWEVVYFAIKPTYVISMIKDCLSPPGDEGDFDLVVAPSLAYTVQDMANENWSYKFTDTHTASDLYAQTVLEVYVRPASYEIISLPVTEPPSHDCGEQLIPENWKVKNLSDIYPKSILVKIFQSQSK